MLSVQDGRRSISLYNYNYKIVFLCVGGIGEVTGARIYLVCPVDHRTPLKKPTRNSFGRLL